MGVNPLALLEGNVTIEGVGVHNSLWGYNDYNENMELNQRLHETAWELQAFQVKARQELKQKEDQIQMLTYQYKKTCQERDSARDQLVQLQILLNKLMPISNYPESPRRTKSDSISYVSSPIDSFFDTGTSNESSHFDQVSARYEQLVSSCKRALPEKGKLMEAVKNAGPLLQTLLVAGPLPQWKNPPPVQPVHIPLVSGMNPSLQKYDQNHMMAMAKRPMAMASSPFAGGFSSLNGKRQRSQ